MSVEMEAVAEFLTGNRLAAPSLPWQLLRNEDVRVLKEWAGETLPVAAQKRLMGELRAVMFRPVEAEDEQVLRSAVAPAMLRTLRRSSKGAHVANRQARLLLDVCSSDERAEAKRDAAVIALMLLAGLRRKEITELQRGDFDDDDARLRIGSRTRHARSVILEGECQCLLEAWLAARGSWAGPLFCAFDWRGEPAMRGIAPSTVNRLLTRRAGESGCAGLTPRDLRRRFLWQLQSGSRERPRCRYSQDENGHPAWVLASMSLV
jgi:integrase